MANNQTVLLLEISGRSYRDRLDLMMLPNFYVDGKERKISTLLQRGKK